MIVREKFSAKEWRLFFAKHSKLGYPSDDTPEEENEVCEGIEFSDTQRLDNNSKQEISRAYKNQNHFVSSQSELNMNLSLDTPKSDIRNFL